MAISKKLGKRSKMSYEDKDFPHEASKNNLAFKVLRSYSKFAHLPVSETASQDEVVDNAASHASACYSQLATPSAHSKSDVGATDAAPAPVESISNACTTSPMSNRLRLGRKAAFRLLQNKAVNQAAIANFTSIAKSLKWQAECMA